MQTLRCRLLLLLIVPLQRAVKLRVYLRYSFEHVPCDCLAKLPLTREVVVASESGPHVRGELRLVVDV